MELGTGTLILLVAAGLALAALCVKRPHLGIAVSLLMFIPAPLFPTEDNARLFYGFAGFTMLVLLGWLYHLSRHKAPFRVVASADHIGSILMAWLVLCLLVLPVSLMFNSGTLTDRLYFYIKALVPFLYLLVFFIVRALPFTLPRVQQFLNCLLWVAIAFAVITFAIYAATGLRVSALYTPLAFPFTVLGTNVTFARLLLTRRRRAMFAWGLLTVILAVAMLLTFTKAQVLAMAMSLMFLAWLISCQGRQQAARRMIGFVALIAIAAIALEALASGRNDTSFSDMVATRLNDESSTETRVNEWQAALHTFAASPVFGEGIGHQLERDVGYDTLTASYVHNQIAYTAMTTGIAGLTVYLLLIYHWAKLVRRFHLVDQEVAAPLATVHACVLTLGVYALMFATFGLIQHNLLLGILLGLAVIMTPKPHPVAMPARCRIVAQTS